MKTIDRGTSKVTRLTDEDYDGVVAYTGIITYDSAQSRAYFGLNLGHTEIEVTWSPDELDGFIKQLKKARRALADG